MKVLCIIPARYASTRLPGKPLRDIAGKPMVVRVCERAARAKLVQDVVVATDDARICAAVEEHGGRAVMTRADHATGTDRLAEVAEKMRDYDLIINVQGDEPLIDPGVIDALVEPFLADEKLPMATAKTLLTDEAEMENPNNVKVIVDRAGNALAFPMRGIPARRSISTSASTPTAATSCWPMRAWHRRRSSSPSRSNSCVRSRTGTASASLRQTPYSSASTRRKILRLPMRRIGI